MCFCKDSFEFDEEQPKQQQAETIKLGDGSSLIIRQLDEIMHDSMMPYAEHVIMDRALPRVEDGLKPVQRRILYSMYELGTTGDKPYRKSARIVGDCLGKYHPHGEKSIYDAMVRMAQSFSMRAPLIDGQGNFGSIDGDSAAAMRYTETRLTPLTLELLRDIEKETVMWSRNFDDTLLEPNMLPGRFPNLLVNGASGIAVGLATNIPPHNLGEVIDGVIAYIDKRKITLKEMMKIIKGPDFPTGGYIGVGELEQAYATGRGKIYLRAKIHYETLANERKNIVITELPYQVNKAELLVKILALREEKKDLLGGIIEIVDESDKEGMRAVIRCKKDCDVEAVTKILFKNTDMQTTFGINMVAIADGKPQQMGLLDIIAYYTDYQRIIIQRRTTFELEEARTKEHILQGLVIAVKNIDEVVAIIKRSSSTADAKINLRSRFDLSDKQAQAILDLRLARLTKLEITKLIEELKELEKLIKHLNELLNNKNMQMELIKQELSVIKRNHKSPRRSTLTNEIGSVKVLNTTDEKPAEDCFICLSCSGTIKRVASKNYALSNKTVAEKTPFYEVHFAVKDEQTNARIFLFTNKGNCLVLEAAQIHECKYKDKGVSLKELCAEAQETEVPVSIFSLGEDMPAGDLNFYTVQGMVKRSSWKEYDMSRNFFQAIKLKEDDSLLNVEAALKGATILFVTKEGMCLNFEQSDVPLQGRIAGGVKGMLLSDTDRVLMGKQISNEGEVCIVTDRGFFKRVILPDIDVMTRYRKGVKIAELKGEAGVAIAFCDTVTIPYDICVFDGNENTVVNTENITIESRSSKGKKLKAKKRAFDVVNVFKVAVVQPKNR